MNNLDNVRALKINLADAISPITKIIEEIRLGRMVILIDEEDRENEGDLVFPAQFIEAEHINFMAKHGRGLICLTVTEDRCQQLKLPNMVQNNGTSFGTNFTISIEAAEGVTTGISAADRAKTIRVAVAKNAKHSDIVSPGHIFPLAAKNGGVLVRAGHTEAGCDLANLAGLEPAAVICEILSDDGSMARLPELIKFAQQHNLKIGTISELIKFRSLHENLVVKTTERPITTPFGELRLVAYTDLTTNDTHIALIKGTPTLNTEVLVRVHEPVSIYDFLDSSSKAHSWNALQALETIAKTDCGVMILMCRNESGGTLLDSILKADNPLERKRDLRDYGIGSQILRDLNVRKMRLMSLPSKIPSIHGFGLEVLGFLSPTHH